MADVHEMNKSWEWKFLGFFVVVCFLFAIFMVSDFHLCTTSAPVCDYICRLNDLGSWCTSNWADFYSDDMKIDQLVCIKHWILLWWLTARDETCYFCQEWCMCAEIILRRCSLMKNLINFVLCSLPSFFLLCFFSIDLNKFKWPYAVWVIVLPAGVNDWSLLCHLVFIYCVYYVRY